MTIWFTADHHFQHANILNFTDKDTGKKLRPEFKTIQDHDNYIIDKHNKSVKDDDLVYFLGDVIWKTNQVSREILEALKGRKRLVVGNHDDVDWLMSTKLFEKVYLWKYFPEHNLIASHVPLHESDLKRAGRNVHGHSHQNVVTKRQENTSEMNSMGGGIFYEQVPDLRYLNVGMERTGYKPWSLETVLAGLVPND